MSPDQGGFAVGYNNDDLREWAAASSTNCAVSAGGSAPTWYVEIYRATSGE